MMLALDYSPALAVLIVAPPAPINRRGRGTCGTIVAPDRPAAMDIRGIAANRRLQWTFGGLVVLLLVAFVAIAAFPFGMLKATIEDRLSSRFGTRVTIGQVERLDSFSLRPTLAIRDVRVPQARWAGSGDLARIATLQVRFPVMPLILGDFKPQSIMVKGLRLSLVRDANGRENWRSGKRSSGGGKSSLDTLQIADSIVSYRDAKVDRSFAFSLSSNVGTGFRLTGKGLILGNTVRIAARGPAIDGRRTAWPFRAAIDGPSLTLNASGIMAAPLDTGHMDLDVEARADDLKLVDAVIEAGLIGTQPLRLKAHARHDGPDWTVTGVRGTIGKSDIAGQISVRKRDGRTKLDGTLTSDALLFDDFASDAGQAQALAKEAAIGVRLVPDTRINIRKIDDTDGTIAFRVKRLIDGRRPSSFTSLSGTLVLDHQLLIVAPLRLGMKRGAITGSLRVDQRGGVPVPLVTLDLALRDSSVEAIAGGGGAVQGSLAARARLSGRGSTIREAVGVSSGSIGVFARDGSLPARVASMIGFDVGRGLLTGKDERADLRCVALRLEMRGGRGRVSPMVIDTTRSQSRGEGFIQFPSEQVSIRLTGAPKQRSILRLPGAVIMAGTIREPQLSIPPEVKSVGNIFKAIGRSITGNQGPLATDADCVSLGKRVLGS